MNSYDISKRLENLSQRERQVLGMVCSGLMYKEISQNLFISLPTVKSVMGRVYVKLGLDVLSKAERMKAIYELYCPLLKASPIPDEPSIPESNEPVSASIIRLVDEDEMIVITPSSQGPVSSPLITSKPAPTRRNRTCLVSGVIGLLVLCCVAIAFLFRNQLFSFLNPSTNILSQPTMEAPIPGYTSPPATSIPVISTKSPQPTAVFSPTDAVTSITLPFTDNFSAGANSAWKIQSGDWLVANNRYTISNGDSQWGMVVLDAPNWTNYRIKTKVKLEKSDEGEVMVIVRYLSNQNKYLVFQMINIFSKGGFAIYDGSNFTKISGYGSVALDHDFDLEIDAIGNNFVAKINGIVTQQINLSGYEQGGVGLGISCFYAPCGSFSNFQITNP